MKKAGPLGAHGHVMAGPGGAASRRGTDRAERSKGERERKERPVERSGHSIAYGVVSALYAIYAPFPFPTYI